MACDREQCIWRDVRRALQRKGKESGRVHQNHTRVV
jgi:hypothetical protein